MDTIKIQTALPEQAAAIAEISAQSMQEAWSEKSVSDAIVNPNAEVWIAEDDSKAGQVLAFAIIFCAGGEAELELIATSSQARRQGIAEQLLREALKNIATNNEAIFLEVRAGNAPAISLYMKLGFIEVGRRKNFYHDPEEDALVMKKILW